MSSFLDLTGRRFGKLSVLRRAPNIDGRVAWWVCCTCGAPPKIVRSNHLTRKTKPVMACGCDYIFHGASQITAEYRTWKSMMTRCYNPNAPGYKWYGGRGIKVCKRWHDFRNFLADMGPRPAGRYSIERTDVNGNYTPSNCIWLPLREQGRNRRNSKR